jgi:hypothetical protein
MSRFHAGVVAAMAFCACASMVPACAAPPTVTPSPGYDARLQEQRNAPAVDVPAARDPKPVSRRRVKPVHDSSTH